MIPITIWDSLNFPMTPVGEYESLIWTERASDSGDFELKLPFNQTVADAAQLQSIVTIPLSKTPMIITKVVSEDTKEGEKILTVSGKDLIYLLGKTYMGSIENIGSDQWAIYTIGDLKWYFDMYIGIAGIQIDMNLPSYTKNGRKFSWEDSCSESVISVGYEVPITLAEFIESTLNIYLTSMDAFLQEVMTPAEYAAWEKPEFRMRCELDLSDPEIVNGHRKLASIVRYFAEPVETQYAIAFDKRYGTLSNQKITYNDEGYYNRALVYKSPDLCVEVYYDPVNHRYTDIPPVYLTGDLFQRMRTLVVNDKDGYLGELTTDEYKTWMKYQGIAALKKSEAKCVDGEGSVAIEGLFNSAFKIGDKVFVAAIDGTKTKATVDEWIFSINSDGYREYPSLTYD